MRPEKKVRKSSPAGRFTPKADRNLRKVFSEIGTPAAEPFVPDAFQEEAVGKISRYDVLVSAPTGSGKTWIALQAMKRILAEGKRAWYASPLKALSNSKFHEFEEEFGKENVGILTGDRKENTDASIVVGTTEILRNQLYDAMSRYVDFNADLVILDEAHYLGDEDRGVVWEEVMIYLPQRVRLLMLSATIRNDVQIAEWLSGVRNHPCHVVHSEERPVPIYPLYLLPSGEMMPLSGLNGVTPKISHFIEKAKQKRFLRSKMAVAYDDVLQVLEKFDLLPAIFFLKSRMECNLAVTACKQRILPAHRSHRIRERIKDFLDEYPFLAKHPQLHAAIDHGLVSHHGGQLPHWKVVIEKLMNEGLLDAIFSTSTVAAGVNFPARTVVLVQSDRFNGKEFVSLSATELHQTTGRAGRRGKDNIGFAVIVHGPFQNPHLIDDLLNQEPDPINSQIKINFSMSLNLLISLSPDEIKKLLNVSFSNFQHFKSVHELEEKKDRTLQKLTKKMEGAQCDNFQEAITWIEARKSAYKKISLLKRKQKKYAKAAYKTGLNLENDDRIKDLNRKIGKNEQIVKKLPCDGCRLFSLCHQGKNTHITKLLYKAQMLNRTIDGEKNALWNEFKRHLEFLTMNGFADKDGTLTPDGVWASKLRLDQPLIIAELIRKNVLTHLTPELLAAVVAVFVNDKFRDIDVDQATAWDKKPLREAYLMMKQAIDEILSLKKRFAFHVPQTQFWPAAAIYNWACGISWDEVLKLISVDEGDLAMLVFRTADNLRQLTSLDSTHPDLAGRARQCIHLLLREPVVIPT